MTEERVAILKKCAFLAGIDNATLAELARHSETREFDEDCAVVTKGEHGSTMFFIVEGAVKVHDGDVVLARLGSGEVFGEMAVLDSDVRSASVTTERATRLICLERDELWQVIAQDTEALKAIIASVLQRERAIVSDVSERTAQVQAFEKELEIGRRIQADFLPEAIPEVDGWEIASYFEAAREVAGDFFDVFELEPGGHLALVIGDVCDKGVGAALFMTLFRSLIRASSLHGMLTESAEPKEDSGERIRDLLQTSIEVTNRYVATTHGNSSMFASVFFGMLDPRSGKLDYINAGHESPVLFRPGEEPQILECTGGVVGLFPFARFATAQTRLQPGDLMFTYTDGVNEAKNEAGEQFSDERILSTGASASGDANELLAQMMSEIKAFRGSAAQSDDITMLAVRWLKNPAE
jgi:sigma-B regulation protein RsbU (phosphoserine phosphatase)